MKVKITGISPEDAFFTGYDIRNEDKEVVATKPVLGLVGDFEEASPEGTVPGFTGGTFKSPELTTCFFAVQVEEIEG